MLHPGNIGLEINIKSFLASNLDEVLTSQDNQKKKWNGDGL